MGSAGNCEHCGTPLFTRAYEALLDAPTYEGSGEYHSAVRCRDKAGRRAERERIASVLRTWASAVEKGHAAAPAGGDVDVIRTLRKSADAIENGEEHPAWAR